MTTLKLTGRMKTIAMASPYPITHDPKQVLQRLLIEAEYDGLRPTAVDYGCDDVVRFARTAANADVIEAALAADDCRIRFESKSAADDGAYRGSVWFIPCNGCDAISDWTVDQPALEAAIDRTLTAIHGSFV